MGYYLLDSDAVIDYLVGIGGSISLLRRLHDSGETLCVSDVVIAEVHSGLRPEEREGADEFLGACIFLPTGSEDARRAGQWRYEYARHGRTLSTTDALVAATALAHRATIVTANVRDYPMAEVTILPLPRNQR